MATIRGIAEKNIILFVSLDDMTKEALLRGAQFGAPLQAKGLDWLNSEWTRFENMQAVVPVCMPSRASMMTSLPPNKTRVWTNDDRLANDALDWSQGWPARVKRRGQVDAAGKLTHGFNPSPEVIGPLYTRFHPVSDLSAAAIAIVSQSGISGTPGQVFDQVRLIPDTAGKKAVHARVTLNAAGTAVLSVRIVEGLETGETAPRYDAAVSGGDFEVGDTLSVGGLGYNAATGTYSMPDARLQVRVTKLASFRDFDEEGTYNYGTFTDPDVIQGDQLLVNWVRDSVAPQIIADNDKSFRAILAGFYGTHTPWMPEQRYLDMYPLASISIPTGYDEPSAYALRYLEEYAATALFNAGKLEEAARYYLAAIEQDIDRLSALIEAFKIARYADGTSLWDRTTVVAWSDHSFHLGNQNSDALEAGLVNKFQPFGTATSCFCAIRIPGLANGVSIREPVSSLDIAPTILAAAGIAIPDSYMGQSLLPALRNPLSWTNSRAAVSVCRGNFSCQMAMTYSGSRQVFRLVRYFNGEEYLYNETADPLNKTSVHANGAHSSVLSAMQAAMNAELTRWGWTVTGTTGDDLFLAYATATLAGGAGDDTYIIGSSATVITEGAGAGDDAILFQPSNPADNTFTVPANVEHVHIDATVDAPVAITGNSTGVEVSGPVASFTGGGGEDSVRTLSNAEVTLAGGGGADDLQSGGGADSLVGDAGNDTLTGGGGADTISGGDDNDSISGGGDNDSLAPGQGNDTVRGNAGDDTVTASDGADLIYGGNGLDSLLGGAGNDTIRGAHGADTIDGGADADLIYGGPGHDSMTGATGADTIQGGAGNNTVTGGGSGDVFQFGNKDNALTITDFAIADGDVLQFKPGIGFGSLGAAPSAVLSAVLAAASDVGPNSVIQTANDNAGTITLNGVLKAAYVEAMFAVADFAEDDGEDDDGGDETVE